MSDQWKDKDLIEGEYEVLDEEDVDYEHYNPYNNHQRNQDFTIDSRPPYVTYIILAINILAYVLMTIAGFAFNLNLNQQLLLFGAKVNILIAYGQYWRLFTAMFLHVGLIHLLFNSYALYNYGAVAERLFGKLKFTIIYLVSGLVGSLFSYLLSANSSAGASGAIFGLMGSLLYFRQRNKHVFQRVFGTGLFMVIGLNLFYGFIQPGIDNWGHIGGLVGGYIVANAVGLYKEKMLDTKKVLIWLLIVLIFFFGLKWGQEKYTIKERIPAPSVPEGEGTIETNYPIVKNGYDDLNDYGDFFIIH